MVFFNMLTLNKQSISSNHIRRVADNVSSVMMEQQQDLKNLQQTNPKKLHFSSPKRSRISSRSKSQHKNLSEMFTADHLENVQVFQRAWKEMEASRERCSDSVVTFQINPETTSRLKDFQPFDLEAFWGRRQLAKLNLDTDEDRSNNNSSSNNK